MLKPTIDRSLRDAGGEPLVRYFEKYADGMQRISRMEMAAKAQQLTPNQLIKLASGNAPERVKRTFGTNDPSLKAQAGSGITGAIRLNAAELNRDLAIREAAKKGDKTAAEVLQQNMFSFGLPNILQREVAALNVALRSADSFMNRKMIQKLTDAMYNPKEAARIIESLPAEQRYRLLALMRDSRLAGAAGGMMTGAME